MTLREQIEEHNRAWRQFHEWEAHERPSERSPASIISDLGTILGWIPRETRLADPDPGKLGVRKMMDALSHLKHVTE